MVHENPFDSGVFGSGQPAQFRRAGSAEGGFGFLERPVAGAFGRAAFVFVGDGLARPVQQLRTRFAVPQGFDRLPAGAGIHPLLRKPLEFSPRLIGDQSFQ
jgi:hypothetical protein